VGHSFFFVSTGDKKKIPLEYIEPHAGKPVMDKVQGKGTSFGQDQPGSLFQSFFSAEHSSSGLDFLPLGC
jgi:hypothetical protein